MKNKIEKDSFIVEVEEDLKNDNLKKLWDKLGVYIIGSMAFILFLTIGIEIYSYFKVKSNQEMTSKYTQALSLVSADNYLQAQLMLAEVEKKGGFIKDLSLIQNVNLLIKQDKVEEAYKLLENISNNSDVSFEIKDVAIMMQASIAVDTKTVDDVAMIIAPLLSPTNPWLYNALEYLAIAQLKAGNKEGAIDLFERIVLESDQESLKNRAVEVLAVIR